MNQSMKKWLPTCLIILSCVIAFSLGIYFSSKTKPNIDHTPTSETSIPGLLWPPPKQLNAFTMQDQNSQPFGLEQIKGRWSLLFFGYTHCPDICPITLSAMNQAYDEINKAYPLDTFQTVFVSVDPKRDTAETLKRYVNHFNDKFIGLTGTMDQMASFTKQLGIPYFYTASQNPQQAAANYYTVDHTASLYLLDDKGRLVGLIRPPHDPKTLAQKVIEISNFILGKDV